MAVLSVGGLRVMQGDLTVGMLVAFQTLMASFIQPVNQLVTLGGTLQDLRGDLNRLQDVLRYPADDAFHEDAESTTASLDRNEEEKQATHKLNGYVELRDVTFGYSPLDPPLIEKFSLKLKPGSRVAIVGPSGSGKSTLSRLVAGLYKPWSGEILFDGVPREQHPRQLLTNSVAIVDQGRAGASERTGDMIGSGAFDGPDGFPDDDADWPLAARCSKTLPRGWPTLPRAGISS